MTHHEASIYFKGIADENTSLKVKIETLTKERDLAIQEIGKLGKEIGSLQNQISRLQQEN